MRKIVGLLAVAVLGSAIAFAQDAAAPTLGVSGYVGAGLKYYGTDDVLKLYDSNNGSAGLRFSINGIVDGGTYGIKWGFATNDVTTGFPANLAPNDTLGWVYLGDKMLKLSVGKLDDGQYASIIDGLGVTSWDGDTGFAADISPIAGLTIGYFLPITTAGNELAASFKSSEFAVTFTADKVVNIRVGFGLNGLASATGENLWLSASLLAVENLTLIVDSQFTALGSDAGTAIGLQEKVGYAFAPVTVALVSRQSLDTDGLTDLELNPSVAYDLGSGSNANLSVDLHTNTADTALGLTWNINPYVNIGVAKNTVQIGADIGTNGAGSVTGVKGDTGFDFYTTFIMNF